MAKKATYVIFLPTLLSKSQEASDEFDMHFWHAFHHLEPLPFKLRVDGMGKKSDPKNEIIILCKKSGLLDENDLAIGNQIAEVLYDTCAALNKFDYRCVVSRQVH